jgi:hypothetical protein
MSSLNFEILRDRWPELAELGRFAEAYAHADPASALLKLRLFAETLTKRIYREFEPLPFAKICARRAATLGIPGFPGADQLRDQRQQPSTHPRDKPNQKVKGGAENGQFRRICPAKPC